MRNWLANVFTKAATGLSLVPTFMGHAAWRLGLGFLVLVNEGYKRNAVAYACIRLLAQSVPEPPLKIYRDSSDNQEEIPDHPLRKLIQHPNPYMTEFEMWELASTYLSMCGRAPFWKERSNGGEPIGLWPLRPDRIAPILGSVAGQDLLRGWEYKLSGDTFQIPANDILFFNYPDPGDETGGIIGGLGPMQVLAREIDTDTEATSFTFAMLSNYAMPGVMLKVREKLTRDQADSLKAKFVTKYGNTRRGEPAIVDNDAEITAMSNTMSDLEFPDLRNISESRIAAGFGVPAVLVGLHVGIHRSTFNNMIESREFFAETTLSVIWRRLSDQITYDLLPEFKGSEGLTTRFDTTGVRALQAQLAERAKRFLDGLRAGAVTMEEYRSHGLNLASKPKDGDTLLRLPNTIVQIVGQPTVAPPMLAPPVAKPALTSGGRGNSGGEASPSKALELTGPVQPFRVTRQVEYNAARRPIRVVELHESANGETFSVTKDVQHDHLGNAVRLVETHEPIDG